MLIVCPNCATSYQVTPESLGETGRTVRCVNCLRTWFQHPLQVAAPAADGPDVDPHLIRPPLNDVVDIGAPETEATQDDPATGFPADRDVPTVTAEVTDHEAAPSIVPLADPKAPSIDVPKSIESIAGRQAARLKTPRRRATLSRHALPASICALVLILMCLVAARQQVVRLLPQTASLYAWIGLPVNLRGLAFKNIKTAHEVQDGVPMLVVEGDIVGTTGRHTEVPRLRLAVIDRNGKEIYAWTARPSRTLLPPGEALPFRSRLASPPAEANGVSVRFFNRRDAQAGFM